MREPPIEKYWRSSLLRRKIGEENEKYHYSTPVSLLRTGGKPEYLYVVLYLHELELLLTLYYLVYVLEQITFEIMQDLHKISFFDSLFSSMSLIPRRPSSTSKFLQKTLSIPVWMASRPIFLDLNRTPYNKQNERERFEPSKVPRTIPVFKTGAPNIHASQVDLVRLIWFGHPFFQHIGAPVVIASPKGVAYLSHII
jgi:hypothetical protein